MTAPELKKAADEAIRTQMADYVRSQIEPVKRDVQDKQQQLERAQISINGQVHVQQLAIASKAGGLAEFVELKKLSESGVETANAQTALKEVELYFDTDRGQLSHPTLVDPISKQSPGFAYEELLSDLENKDPSMREAAVNVIAQVSRPSGASKGIVQELITALQNESNLRVIARISRAVSIISKEEFKPLDRDGILAWWRLHEHDSLYQSPYGGYRRALPFLGKNGNSNDVPKSVTLLDETLKLDPDALYTRALKMRCLIAQNDLPTAENELAELEKRAGDFRWGLLWKSLLL